jgi:hypothetical protein
VFEIKESGGEGGIRYDPFRANHGDSAAYRIYPAFIEI